MTGNIYLDLTNEFNLKELRAILSSGQAIVVHGLALSSKDGDWIVRENADSLAHILSVLESHGARYRLGAPLDERWMKGAWSAHFEFNQAGNRVRCDFVSRPPRLAPDDLAALWREMERGEGVQEPVPTIDVRRLAELKKTDRERDYAFIGEIARLLRSPSEEVLLSRSARDLLRLWPQLSLEEQRNLLTQRSLLKEIPQGREAVEVALDAERRTLARVNQDRLAVFGRAAQTWTAAWTQINREIDKLPLSQAHQIMVEHAKKYLPEVPDERL